MELAKAALKLSGQSSSASPTRGVNAISRWHIMLAVEVFDLLIICASGSIAYQIWVADPGISFLDYTFSVLLVERASYLSFLDGHLYGLDQLFDEARDCKSTILRWTLIFAVLAAAASLARQPLLPSHRWFCSFYVIGGVLLVACYRVKRGMTGCSHGKLASAGSPRRGKPSNDVWNMIHITLSYIENWSLMPVLLILIKTEFAGFMRKTAFCH